MDNTNYLKITLFLSFTYMFFGEMGSKFFAGVFTGIYISSKYDFKPYVKIIEDKIYNLQKELEQKRDEIQKSQMIDNNWNFKWFKNDNKDIK